MDNYLGNVYYRNLTIVEIQKQNGLYKLKFKIPSYSLIILKGGGIYGLQMQNVRRRHYT